MPLTIREYVTGDGATPFRVWLETLVWEARLFSGSGYRLYFGKANRSTIVLLLGGSKSSQRADLHRARQLWREYLEQT